MGTTKLALGQAVYMFCGARVYGYEKGKVVTITSASVEVQTDKSLIRFDNDGVELEADWHKRCGVWSQSSSHECGFWTLDDETSFEERTAQIEHHKRLMMGIIKTLAVGQEAWMKSGPYVEKGTVIEVTAKYVAVELTQVEDARRFAYLFDAVSGQTGSGCYDGLGVWEWIAGGWMQEDPGAPGTECGPWKLVA
jgi:hypothetical protein